MGFVHPLWQMAPSEKHVVFIVRYGSVEGIKTMYLKAEAIPDGKAQCATPCKLFLMDMVYQQIR